MKLPEPIGPQFPLNRLDPRAASPQFKQPASTSTSTSTVSLSTASLSTSTTKSDAMHERTPLTECEEETLHKSKTLDRALRSNALFLLLPVLVLSIAVLVLVLVLDSIRFDSIRFDSIRFDSIEYSNPANRSPSSPKPRRSMIGIAAVPTAIEYEYRFTE